MAEFNLIVEKWIPCVDLNGRQVEYGIKDTLLKAHELREIVDDSPLVTVAIHRLLLAILYRAFEGPTSIKEWREIYDLSAFQAEGPVDSYLDKWQDRFYLFHETHPFMQVAGLELNEYKSNGEVQKDKSSAMMRLAKEAPDAGGRILFDHRMGDDRPEYAHHRIVKMLLSAQNYAGTGVASGGKVKGTTISPTACAFAPCVDGLILWLQGDNLFQTLMLNLVPQEVCVSDLPAWEDDHIVPSAINSWSNATSFTGPCQRFAPLSRFIRAIDNKSIFFTNGLKVAADANDPMKAYSRSSDTEEYKAVKLREEKAAWRESYSLFAIGSSTRKPPSVINHAARLLGAGAIGRNSIPRANVVGMATDKDKALLWRHERMPVPVHVLDSVDLTERLARLIAEAEAVGGELSRGLFWSATSKKTIRTEPVGRVQLIADILLAPSLEIVARGVVRTSNGRAPEDAHNKAALDLSDCLDPRTVYWARLERHFFNLLEELPNDWDAEVGGWKPDDKQAATNLWRENVKREAKRALEESTHQLGTSARAIQAVARVSTIFNDEDLKPPAQKVAKVKDKGGKKKK